MKKLTLGILVIALLSVAGTTFAGQKASVPVSINQTYKYALGALGTARNSADGSQKIGCGVYSSETTGAYASCAAIDANGNRAWCTSTNEAIIKAAQSISGDSHIIFYWTATGTCDRLQVLNDSSVEPKKS